MKECLKKNRLIKQNARTIGNDGILWASFAQLHREPTWLLPWKVERYYSYNRTTNNNNYWNIISNNNNKTLIEKTNLWHLKIEHKLRALSKVVMR